MTTGSGDTMRVLVAENDSMIRDMISEMLQQIGVQMAVASTYQEADTLLTEMN
jgi:CheY-like chemotaxis protein